LPTDHHSSAAAPLRAVADGVVIAVRAVPGSSRAGVQGVVGDELRVKVCSPPVDGRANEELCEVVAAALGVKARLVTVVGGQLARSKQVLVRAELESVQTALEAVLSGISR
jgi:uncharacterized protein (TIGR00251 family)